MCTRNKDMTLTLCDAAERAQGRNFYMGSWVSKEGFGRDKPVQCPAMKSGEFSRGAGARVNFCPWTGEDLQWERTQNET